jgi:hypothetical protein
MDDKSEFFVRHTRPYFGVINEQTDVRIDAELPKQIRNVRIAPLWAT